jgi:hypothetical protein
VDPLATVAQYVARGRSRLVDLLDAEHAVIWDEVEARLSEPYRDYVEPHHLTTARQQLRAEGVIAEPETRTRGGRSIRVVHRADVPRRTTAIARAARRKRLLHARYLSWTTPSTRYPQGRIGPAAEVVTHKSLKAASPYGYRLLNPDTGGVISLFGTPVPGGPLDNCAYLTTIDENRAPRPPILVPIEVKNTRHWIYTQHRELHQVLYKAASLKRAHPDLPVVPVLVCRRRQYHTREMGVEIGVYVIETRRQPVLPSDINETRFDEVRSELAYDVVLTDEPDAKLISAFEALPKYAEQLASNWASKGQHLVDFYGALRSSDLRGHDRLAVRDEMREAAREIGCTGSWTGAGSP